MRHGHSDGISCERSAVTEAISTTKAIPGRIKTFDGSPVGLKNVLVFVGYKAGIIIAGAELWDI